MAFADLTARLNLDISKFSAALNSANDKVTTFSSSLTEMVHGNDKRTKGLVENYKQVDKSLHNVALSLRDVSRIASGIVVAQAFYRTADAIKNAVAALWEFNTALDYANVTYSALFGSSDLASSFLQELQQFSVDTIFQFSDLENMSRKLLAYGIEYKNLMYIIQGLSNIGTLSGDSAALERLAVAIGQINAKGTLKAEEVRQLANAYVPIYDILRDKMGLTDEDFKSIGDLGIKSADAINAIVEYSNERFGDMANAAMMTITGLNNRIVDSFKVMGADMLKPVTTAYKSLAFYIAKQLETIYDIYKKSGAGGVFEYLVPSVRAQQIIREFIATTINGFYTIAAVARMVLPLLSNFFLGVVQGATFVKNVINVMASVVAMALRLIGIHTPILTLLSKALFIAGVAAGVFAARAAALFALRGLAAMFTGIAKAVMLLTIALTRNPIVMGLAGLALVLGGITAKANGANNAISSLIKTLSSYSAGGKTYEDILQPSTGGGGGGGNAGDFWNEMEDGANNASDAMDDAGKAADKAAKKANKSLLSFDEVFKLNENVGGSGGSGGGGMGDLSGLGDLGNALGGLGDSLIPNIPSFKDFAKNFVTSLYNDLWEALKTIGSGASVGALIGALTGFVIGGLATKTMPGAMAGAKLGAKIGAAVGGTFAAFWTDAYKEMEGSLAKIAIAGTAGALVGALVGFVIGGITTKDIKSALFCATLGGRFGTILGMGIGSFWALATDEMSNAIEGLMVGGAAGALVGALTGFVIGAFSTKNISAAIGMATIGAKVGTVIGAGLGAFWGNASKALKDSIKSLAIATSVTALLGALTGFVIGAFATRNIGGAMAGAKIGTAIGAAIGSTTQTAFADARDGVVQGIEGMFGDLKAASYGALIGGLVGMIIGAIVGAFAGGVGALPGAMAGAKLGAAIGALGGMVASALEGAGIFEAIGGWFDKLGQHIKDIWETIWDINTWKTAWQMVVKWFEKLKSDIGSWFLSKVKDIKDWWENLWIVQKWVSGWSKIVDWFTKVRDDIKAWFDEKIAEIKDWWEDLWTVSRWTKAWSLIVDWFTKLRDDVKAWFDAKVADVKTWWENLWVVQRWVSGWSKVTTWFGNLKSDIKAWFDAKIADIKAWWENLWIVKNWPTGWTKVSDWFSSLKSAVSGWFGDRIADIKAWWGDLWIVKKWKSGWSKVSDWFSSLKGSISGWFDDRIPNIKSWWSDLWSTGKWSSGWSKVKKWFGDLKDDISSWFSSLKTSINSWWDGLFNNKSATVEKNDKKVTVKAKHARGGIFNREHIARFAEGNKAEAVIPLENDSAMQPFVDSVSRGLIEGLAPTLMQFGGAGVSAPGTGTPGTSGYSDLPPMYVGTLIADERGLKELYKKFEVIKVQENTRRGLATV